MRHTLAESRLGHPSAVGNAELSQEIGRVLTGRIFRR